MIGAPVMMTKSNPGPVRYGTSLPDLAPIGARLTALEQQIKDVAAAV